MTLNCLSVSHQKNVPQAILSDTAFLRLLMTLVLRKCLPVPLSDYTVCVDLLNVWLSIIRQMNPIAVAHFSVSNFI